MKQFKFQFTVSASQTYKGNKLHLNCKFLLTKVFLMLSQFLLTIPAGDWLL